MMGIGPGFLYQEARNISESGRIIFSSKRPVWFQILARRKERTRTLLKTEERTEREREHGSISAAETATSVGSFVVVVAGVVHEARQAEEIRRRRRGGQGTDVGVTAVRPSSASVHERHFEHHTRLRRGVQLLGASSLSPLQIWLPDLGIQVQ